MEGNDSRSGALRWATQGAGKEVGSRSVGVRAPRTGEREPLNADSSHGNAHSLAPGRYLLECRVRTPQTDSRCVPEAASCLVVLVLLYFLLSSSRRVLLLRLLKLQDTAGGICSIF